MLSANAVLFSSETSFQIKFLLPRSFFFLSRMKVTAIQAGFPCGWGDILQILRDTSRLKALFDIEAKLFHYFQIYLEIKIWWTSTVLISGSLGVISFCHGEQMFDRCSADKRRKTCREPLSRAKTRQTIKGLKVCWVKITDHVGEKPVSFAQKILIGSSEWENLKGLSYHKKIIYIKPFHSWDIDIYSYGIPITPISLVIIKWLFVGQRKFLIMLCLKPDILMSQLWNSLSSPYQNSVVTFLTSQGKKFTL